MAQAQLDPATELRRAGLRRSTRMKPQAQSGPATEPGSAAATQPRESMPRSELPSRAERSKQVRPPTALRQAAGQDLTVGQRRLRQVGSQAPVASAREPGPPAR